MSTDATEAPPRPIDGPTLPPPSAPPAPPEPGDRPGWARTATVAAAIAAVVSAGVAVPVTWALAGDEPTPAPTGTQHAEPAPGSVADIAATVGPSVARVSITGPQGNGSGSAVIYRSDGYLVTNAHVVATGGQVTVTLPDGTTLPAEVVGADSLSDLAVLRVDAEELPVPTYADTTPAVGDLAVAIGSPFGLDGSVTSGIVSAVGRSVSTPGAPLVDMIQTDAAINPGNSGGALVDASGRIVGINTAILSRTGTNNGIGFAIPVATVRTVADQLIETGQVEHAFLGVQGVTLDPGVAQRYGLDAESGAVIVAVEPDSPAAAAGLREGDTVVAFDDRPVGSMEELAGAVQRSEVGRTVPLTVLRDGRELTLETTLAERPAG
ncbi:S1C family serine protease [Nitriliruptor alkaliphilus]|uniref:S1C family serine protease n=1 Tax=Nitriliruptor alkaliphilus TaxID=427918 RepID=UPI000695CD3A|nr:trypsin-like peptidase domain-containing protein [Nitriliruptor alkaliphilus]